MTDATPIGVGDVDDMIPIDPDVARAAHQAWQLQRGKPGERPESFWRHLIQSFDNAGKHLATGGVLTAAEVGERAGTLTARPVSPKSCRVVGDLGEQHIDLASEVRAVALGRPIREVEFVPVGNGWKCRVKIRGAVVVTERPHASRMKAFLSIARQIKIEDVQ